MRYELSTLARTGAAGRQHDPNDLPAWVLIDRLKSLGLSLRQISKQTGITPPTLCRIHRSKDRGRANEQHYRLLREYAGLCQVI